MSSGLSQGSNNQPRRLKILLISNHRRFKVYFRGYPWARELARRGHDVDLFCHADTARVQTSVEHVDGFRIVSSPDMLVGALRQGWDPYCAVRRAAFLWRENKDYDIIHCLDTRPAVIGPGLLLARARGIPIVSDWIDWWGRGGLIAERRPRWYQMLFGGFETWFEEHFRARLDGLSTISHALQDRGIKLGCDRNRSIVINGAADLDTFGAPASKDAARDKLGLPRDVPVLGFSGLDVLIDLPLAVQAFAIVRKTLPNARLLLVGPSAQDLAACDVDGETAKAVHAIGKVPYGQLPELLPAADAFLLPFPNKIVNVGRWPNKVGDYMAVGRPTISNPVGELVELFARHDIGRLADETPEAMAAAAVALLSDAQTCARLGENARRAAEMDLSWQTQVGRLEQWYRDILAAVKSGHRETCAGLKSELSTETG